MHKNRRSIPAPFACEMSVSIALINPIIILFPMYYLFYCQVKPVTLAYIKDKEAAASSFSPNRP